MPAQKSTRWRSFAVRFVVLLALGAATTVAVSWTLARFALVQSANGRFVFDDGEHVWRVTSLDGMGSVLYKWKCFYRWKDSATPERRAALIAHLTRRDTNDLLGYWRRLPDSAPRPRLRQLQRDAATQAPAPAQDVSIPTELLDQISSVTTLPSSMDVYYGLPLPALRFTLHDDGSSQERARGALVLESVQTENLPPYKPQALRLPLIPVAYGFAINTAFYAAIWTAPYLSFLGIRRFRTRRRRRGQCPKCAYDLEHKFLDGCPECGWNRIPSDPRKIRRRRIWALAWRLTLAILVTVGVSWTTVIFEPNPSAPISYLHDDGAFIWSMEERENSRQRIRDWIIVWRWSEGVSQELRADFLEEEMSRKSLFKQMPLPPSIFESRRDQLNALNARWGAPRVRDRPGVADWDNRVEDFGRFEFIEYESGWPAFAMCSTRLFTGGNWVTDGAFVTRRKRGEPLDLPYHILPLGFLINTALVTALLYLPRMTTSFLRRIRKRRGRCPTCAATLGENAPIGCAACGWKPTT